MEWLNTGLGALAVGMLAYVLKLLANHCTHLRNEIKGEQRRQAGRITTLARLVVRLDDRVGKLPCTQHAGCEGKCKEAE